jgi:hypothetical protein
VKNNGSPKPTKDFFGEEEEDLNLSDFDFLIFFGGVRFFILGSSR